MLYRKRHRGLACRGRYCRSLRTFLALLLPLWVSRCGPETPSLTALPRVDFLITARAVITMDTDFTVFEPGFVAVRGELVAAVGPLAGAEGYRADRHIEARDQILLPGLINGHQHAPMVLFRGLGSDLSLMQWLDDYIFPVEAKTVDRDFVYWGTLLAAAEMIRSGTTTFADMYYFEDEVARAVAKVGMRGILGETVISFPAPDYPTPEQTLAFTERFIRNWKNHPLIIPAVAPHAPYTCSEEVLKACFELAERYDVPLLIHLAETQDEEAQLLERTGLRPIRYLDQIGLLADRVVANHVVWADRQELLLLKERRVGVIHNPESNMKMASGVASIPEMLELGVDVGLGTDGAASNDNLDLFQEMDSMAKLHKLSSKDPTALSARTALMMATLGSARALNLDHQLGSIETGKKADFILVDLGEPAAKPYFDPYSLLVYALNGNSVDTVMVNGKILMSNREITGLDMIELYRHVDRLAQRIRLTLDSDEKSRR